MRKTGLAVISAVLLAASGSALAHDTGDCFPLCAAAVPAAEPATLNLCDQAIVREGLRLEQETRPIREVVKAVQDPTGFVIRQVSTHVVPIPRWIGYVVDPRGAVRAKVIQTVRDEMKKSMGLANDCREIEPAGEPDYSAMT